MGLADIATWIGAELGRFVADASSSPAQLVAAGGAVVGIGFVIASSFVRTMVPLRWLGVCSDLGMITFGALRPSPITLVIAATLLPINVVRAIQVTRLTRRVRSVRADADMTELWLKPYMKSRWLKAGQTLFNKGDPADRLYLLVDGTMVLSDIGKPLELGRIFGEIALFSPSGTRTHTALCVSPCQVLDIHADTVRQLYYQSPAFGFHVIELLAGRLLKDVERARTERAHDGG